MSKETRNNAPVSAEPVPQSYKGTDGNVACVADVKSHLSRLTAKDEPQLYAKPVQLDNLPDATEMIEPPQNGSGFMLGKDRAKRIYIAGPMTGIEDFNFPAFNTAAQSLIEDGWHVENPADHGVVLGAEWEDYLAYDLTRLGTCGAIYLLPGWQASKGATLEVHIAQALGMEIFTAKGAIEPSGNAGELPDTQTRGMTLGQDEKQQEKRRNSPWLDKHGRDQRSLDLRALMDANGLSPKDVGAMLRRSPKTVKYWLVGGQQNIPVASMNLLRMKVSA